ncbi:CRISPR-associated endonuclease Cas3'' [Streptomyces sp. NPDC052396]|uniref:CRISPR-associated endonuclease Cas3'' n=1 Tax=Streptomyces sp. NPDC052396 TaxID=3365689 RepID=UPI0037D8DC0C
MPLWGCAGDQEHARAVVALCAGLHDIGKISGFQLRDDNGQSELSEALCSDMGKIGVERSSHDVAGMEAAPAVLAALGFPKGAPRRGVVARVAQVIGGHHGRFCYLDRARIDNPAFSQLLGGTTWEQQRVAHAAAVYRLLGEPEPPEDFKAPAAVLVTGLVILADWLVSQEDFIRQRQWDMPSSLEEHFARALAAAPRLVGEAGLVPVELAGEEFAQAYGISAGPNALQRSVMEELPPLLAAGQGSEADAVRLLCAYQHEQGAVTLDPAGEIPLPGRGDDGRIVISDVRAVMRRTIPVRADWFPKDSLDVVKPPAAWAEHPMLGDLVVLRQPVTGGEV